MKPTKAPNPSEKAKAKLAELELEFEFPEIDIPDGGGQPELPIVAPSPDAPTFPDLTLPDVAMADVDIPWAQLPSDIFDLG